MSTFSAITVEPPSDARQIMFVIYPGIALLDLAGPLQVFSWAREPGTDQLGYHTRILSHHGGRVPSDTLVEVDSDAIASCRTSDIDTLIVIGGDGVYAGARDADFVASIALLASMSRRVCSVCSGSYLLARAGLLHERRAVTHWEDADILKRDFPSILLETDPIYIKDGHVWTSAGVTAGIDMSIAIVAEDLGREAALERAQSLVTYMVRPGGQSQFSPALERQKLDRDGRFEALHEWIADNLRENLSVEQLAGFESMSIRNFHRVYIDTMGMTPARAVASIRMERARDMLETSSTRIKSVAYMCGFRSEEQMRRTFLRVLGLSPTEYRNRFQLVD
ncbi:MAG: helix-turn-helix domain-containing protein [Pseudomonadota bacterium]